MARILISGGSLGGLMAANILLRAGHDVLVLERSTRSLEGRGAGIVTHENLRAALRQCGAVVDRTLGVPVESRVVLDARGNAECRWVHPQVLTSWGRLYSLLRAALPAEHYRLGAQVAGVEQTEAGVAVRLASGESVSGELLIACDGIRSSVRAQFAPKVLPLYANYIAWRGVCDEASLSRHTRETLFGH
ncbi:MAG TPA: FAD-dependent monooxygenase, partial [Piscinibacter sp.]|nr:FAD-dependent monooxygenase [Piscinibacter sp.]HOY37219.1 FAD-dependent monooxygenase [Piscinibacter sp.]